MSIRILALAISLIALWGCSTTSGVDAPVIDDVQVAAVAAQPVAPRGHGPAPAAVPDRGYSVELAHGEVRRGTAGQNCIALTFDDGPHPTLTPRLLETLAELHVQATFFLVGNRVAQWPEIATAIHQGGHEIGNHSWSHANLTQLDSPAVQREISRTDEIILSATGVRPDIIRLPYDGSSARVLSLIDRPVIFWDIDTLDWKNPSVPAIVSAAGRASSGSIVLMHDIHSATVNSVRGIVENLRARGYEFVTVSELMSGRPCTPTVVAGLQ